MSKDFAARLKQACDSAPREDLRRLGRQAIIARHLEVSEEAVRKWFAGATTPRREPLTKLASFLGVDESWLLFGVEPEMDRREIRQHVRVVSGAVLYVRGLITMAGGTCADPSPKDPRGSYVDFYTIINGVQHAVRVVYGRENDSTGEFTLPIPKEYDELRVLGVLGNRGRYDVIDMPAELIDQHKARKGGDYAVTVLADGQKYHSDGTTWPKIRSFETLD